MAYMLMHYKTAGFDQWQRVFRERAAIRKEAGCKGGWLLRDAAKPNEVFLLWNWESLEKAQAFASSLDLKAAWERAGVIEKPEITYFEGVELVPV